MFIFNVGYSNTTTIKKTKSADNNEDGFFYKFKHIEPAEPLSKEELKRKIEAILQGEEE